MTYEFRSLSAVARDKDSEAWNSRKQIISYMIETYDNYKWQWNMTMTYHNTGQ